MPKWIKELHDAEWLRAVYAVSTCEVIADQLGCSKSGVINALKRHGITARPPGRPSVSERLVDKAWLEANYSKFTTHEIAEQLGCSQRTVWEAMTAAGIQMNGHGKRRRKHPYKQRLGDRGEIIQEHRYVMQKHLGRKLLPSEHVHHINGIKDDNRLDNLITLSASAHHKLHAGTLNPNQGGYQRVCVACGSSFIGGNVAKRCINCR